MKPAALTDSLWDQIEQVGLETNLVDSDEELADDDPSKYAVKSRYKPLKVDFTPVRTESSKRLFITKNGAFIKFEYLNKNSLAAIKCAKRIENYFTLHSKTILGHMVHLKCCRMDVANKRIIVPRFGVFEILASHGLTDYVPISQIAPGEAPDIPFVWKGKQTNNQQLIAERVMKKYYSKERVKLGSAGVIINLEAGQGKSYLAAYIMSVIGKKTAIILHSSALVDQWTKVLTAAFGNKISIGHYHSKKKKLGDVMILIVDSASNDEFKIDGQTFSAIEFYNRFGFIILDECHMYSSKTALKALRSAQTPYMMGLSATPDEHPDGYDKAVWWSIGPVLDAATIPGFVATSDDFSAEVHRVMYYGSSQYTRSIVNRITEMTSVAETVNMICEDEIRNHVVVDCILAGLEKNLFMFVFADRREYLSELRVLLQSKIQVDSEIVENDSDFIRVVGGAKSSELENAEIKSKVIFTTYSYMGTGKSVVKMNGLVMATPRKSKMKQYINRIFRLGSDATIKRHIWDICDMKIKVSSQWNVRHNYYRSKKYTITQTKVVYSDVDTGAGIGAVLDADSSDSTIEKKPTIEKNPTAEKNKLDSVKTMSIVSSLMASLKKKK